MVIVLAQMLDTMRYVMKASMISINMLLVLVLGIELFIDAVENELCEVIGIDFDIEVHGIDMVFVVCVIA